MQVGLVMTYAFSLHIDQPFDQDKECCFVARYRGVWLQYCLDVRREYPPQITPKMYLLEWTRQEKLEKPLYEMVRL